MIFLSFANVKETTFINARKSICHIITRLYNQCDFLLASGKLNEKEKEMYERVSDDMEEYFAADTLNSLSNYLNRYYGQKVLIFLDEYDTPLQEAYVHGYWKELVEFIRKLFNSTFKTNPYMERAIMTGITRVSKESIFSDLNNLTVVTTTSEKYRTQFGFTEEEVFDELDSFGMSEKKDGVKKWYDGFTFGSLKDVYNPWSIINFLEEKKYRPYWANSSSNSLVGLLIRQGNAETKMIVEDLMKGRRLETEIDEEIIFDQLLKKKGAVWSLLLASGYLKAVEWHFSEETGISSYCLELTNQEVHIMFRNMIHGWFSQEDIPYNNFIKALLLDDVEAMNEFMNEIALATFSSFDIATSVAKNDAPERFYHGFVLGLMVELADRYEITSNPESRFGRYDIQLVPREGTELDPMMIEFKVRKPLKEASLEETAAAELAQIRDKNYDASLIDRGFEKERIRHYGFAFEGKQVLIREEREI